jgi:hypothetical protein
VTRAERRLLAEVENSSLCWEVRALVQQCGRWQSSPTFLLRRLNESATPANRESPTWPKNANQLGAALKSFAPGLRLKSVAVTYSRNSSYGGRLWHLRQLEQCDEPEPSTPRKGRTDQEAMYRAGYLQPLRKKPLKLKTTENNLKH